MSRPTTDSHTGPVSEPRTTSELVAGWWQHLQLSSGGREARKRLQDGHELFADAGWQGVTDRMERGGVAALDLIDALLAAGPADEDAVGQVGAGPLEDLLHQHGAALVDEVERRALQDARFRQALSGVWLEHGVLDGEVQRRLERWVTVMSRGGSAGSALRPAPGRRTDQRKPRGRRR